MPKVDLTQKNIENFIDDLIYLEENLGKHANFYIMSPMKNKGLDSIALQSYAKEIANFIGIRNKTFLVTFAKQNKKVGGTIEPQHDQVIPIEIDSAFSGYFDQCIAILAHEITHQKLFNCNLKRHLEIANEVLTDIASIYFGLGKIVLNGCYYYDKVETKREKKYDKKIVHYTETTKEIGYLTHESFSFIYLLICNIRNIQRKDYESGLSRYGLSLINYGIVNDWFQKTITSQNNYESIIQNVSNYLNSYNDELIKINNTIDNHKTNYDKSIGQFNDICDKYKKIDNELNPVLKELIKYKYNESRMSSVKTQLTSGLSYLKRCNNISIISETIEKQKKTIEKQKKTIRKIVISSVFLLTLLIMLIFFIEFFYYL